MSNTSATSLSALTLSITFWCTAMSCSGVASKSQNVPMAMSTTRQMRQVAATPVRVGGDTDTDVPASESQCRLCEQTVGREGREENKLPNPNRFGVSGCTL